MVTYWLAVCTLLVVGHTRTIIRRRSRVEWMDGWQEGKRRRVFLERLYEAKNEHTFTIVNK